MASELGTEEDAPLYGVAGEFTSVQALADAVRELSRRSLGRVDAFAPVPVEGLQDVTEPPRPVMQPVTMIATTLGGSLMMGMCLYATAYDYVFNIGGRPLVSWPSFVVPSVSFALLCGALALLLVLLFLNRLPRLNHPAFNIPNFDRASQDRFFVAVEAHGEPFDPEVVEAAMRALPIPPVAISRVPR